MGEWKHTRRAAEEVGEIELMDAFSVLQPFSLLHEHSGVSSAHSPKKWGNRDFTTGPRKKKPTRPIKTAI